MTSGRRHKVDVPFPNDADVLAMVDEFEACVWPYERWTHRAHVGVAVSYLRRWPLAQALDRMRHGIHLYNRTRGDPAGYHETITVLFLRRIAADLPARPADEGIAATVEALAGRYDMRWPLAYYSAGRLWSDEARQRWTEPDLKALDF